MALGSRFHATRGDIDRGAGLLCCRHVRRRASGTPVRLSPSTRRGTTSDPRSGAAAGGDQSLEQRWFAGSHSNIGGGYVHDGLANIPFRWLLDEAAASGLAIDRDFVKPYNPYPQARLYRSTGPVYRALEFVRLRSGKGKRRLTGHPETAGIDPRSVGDPPDPIRPDEHPQLEQLPSGECRRVPRGPGRSRRLSRRPRSETRRSAGCRTTSSHEIGPLRRRPGRTP